MAFWTAWVLSMLVSATAPNVRTFTTVLPEGFCLAPTSFIHLKLGMPGCLTDWANSDVLQRTVNINQTKGVFIDSRNYKASQKYIKNRHDSDAFSGFNRYLDCNITVILLIYKD
jgi:hypothetical protein